MISTEDRCLLAPLKIPSPGGPKAFQIFLFPPGKPPMPSREAPSPSTSPGSRFKPPHFPCDPGPGLCRHQNGRTGLQGAFGVLGSSPRSPHGLPPLCPSHRPGPILACLLLLLILAASAPPQHFDSPRPAEGSGWGQEAATAECSAPSRAQVPYPQPPHPVCPAPGQRPSPSPHTPRRQHFTIEERGRGRGVGKARYRARSRCSKGLRP